MKEPSKCSVQGCVRLRGPTRLCHMHYKRKQLTGNAGEADARTTPNGKPFEFLERLCASPPHGCVIWPYSTDGSGYGKLFVGGKFKPAHVQSFIMFHKTTPLPGFHLAHFCFNRGCVNPLHVRIATAKENAGDMVAHGTRQSGERHAASKLSNAQADYIRASAAPGVELATEFNVSTATVSLIRNGKIRKPHLSSP